MLDRRFSFNAGDYVFINIPSVSKWESILWNQIDCIFPRFEWHPFTISSAPEKKDLFSVHIRAAGGWTNALYNFVLKENNKWKQVIKSKIDRNKVSPDQAWYEGGDIEPTQLKVYIDGPHSAPSSTIFSSEHAVLVATGIGVTPFASILQSIVARFQERRSLGDLKQVDFIWVNRDYQSLDWFLLLLRDLER